MINFSNLVVGRNDKGERVSYLGEESFFSIENLVARVPKLLDPSAATELARHVTNFSRGSDYILVEDPQTFASQYRTKLENEDKTKPWREGVNRLCDFGIPDFNTIEEPKHLKEELVFFVKDRYTGLPYRVTASLTLLSEPNYEPVPLDNEEGRDD